ncbi:MAG: hypothetical protein ACOY3P_15475 [Planctomycetota bacterium]
MNRTLTTVLLVLLSSTAVHAAAPEEPPRAAGRKDRNAALYQSNSAMIVVTGMRLDENPDNYTKDLSVAEGAIVQVIAEDGAARKKKTEVFTRRGKKGGSPEEYYTADFSVDLGTTYSITMTFKNGTAVEIKDYAIPRDWKTHFYFHSTDGQKSPASILRFVEDPKTRLRCCVYAVYPLDNYRKLGGRQMP